MKKFLLSSLVLLAIVFSVQAQNPTTIKVAGNCGMCKKHIEKAAKDAGATTATWDKVSKLLTVSFDPAKTSNDKIETSVAAAGYDTEHKQASEEAYKKLDECCQYDRKTKKQ
jgi:Skp family chaperone for outer membrane proteins